MGLTAGTTGDHIHNPDKGAFGSWQADSGAANMVLSSSEGSRDNQSVPEGAYVELIPR